MKRRGWHGTIHGLKRLCAVLLVPGIVLAGIALSAGPASAKSDIYFAAGPHNARLGRPVHLSGNADDDQATYNRFCIQERYGKGIWHTLRCAAGGYNGGGSLNFWIRPERRGLTFFRGVLLEGRSAGDRHVRIHLISRAFALAVA